jgi:hypothetical protein
MSLDVGDDGALIGPGGILKIKFICEWLVLDAGLLPVQKEKNKVRTIERAMLYVDDGH